MHRRRARGNGGLLIGVFLALSCVGYDAGIDVEVELVSPRATLGTGVENATLLIENMELISCETSTGVSLEWGVAFAHGSETRSDVVDVLEVPRRVLTTLRPAPGDYCALRIHLGDAERDAASLEGPATQGQRLVAERQDIDLPMNHAFVDPRRHSLVLRYDYTLWANGADFASSFSLETE